MCHTVCHFPGREACAHTQLLAVVGALDARARSPKKGNYIHKVRFILMKLHAALAARVLSLMLCMAAGLSAGVVYNNGGPNADPNTGGLLILGSNWSADDFLLGSNTTISSVGFYFQNLNGITPAHPIGKASPGFSYHAATLAHKRRTLAEMRLREAIMRAGTPEVRDLAGSAPRLTYFRPYGSLFNLTEGL